MSKLKPVLIVDFDLTLIKQDLFMFNLKKLIKNDFGKLLKLLFKARNWIELKNGVLLFNSFTFEEVVNSDLLLHIRKIENNFELIVVVSATPQDFLSDFIPKGYFDGVYGSIIHNLKGRQKLNFIENKFGANFGYIGDSKFDNIIFSRSIYADRVTENEIINLKNEIF
jgi:hypothetical protein